MSSLRAARKSTKGAPSTPPASLSGRIAIPRDGRIQQCGAPRELYDQPVNRFVASFFGGPPTNSLEGRITSESGKAWLQLEGQRLPLGAASEQFPAGEVTLGIRPEHIRLNREQVAVAWPMRVALVEPHGGQSHLELEGDGLRLIALAGPDTALRMGELVYVTAPRKRMHMFDARTGDRIT